MSGRGGRSGGGGRGGGGRRGRGGDSGRGQPSQPVSRGGGGGGGGRGRGSNPPPASNNPPPSQMAPVQSPLPSVATTSTAPVNKPPSVESLTGEMSKKLTLAPVTAKTATSQLPPSSSKAMRFPPRPGFGTVGKKCTVRANHFLVDVATMDLHQYDVTITPEITSKKVNREIIKELVKVYKESNLGSRSPAYDGRKSLYTAGPLPFESKEFIVKLTDTNRGGDSSSTPARRERQFKVAIKLASKPDIHYLREFLNRRHYECPQETIQVLDVVLRAKPSDQYTVVGRSFFSPSLGPTGELGNGIQYWTGYYQSLRPTQMGLSLNIDVSARSFYEPIFVTEFITKHFRRSDLSRPMLDHDRIRLKKALKGVKVKLSYLKYTKTAKIIGISREPANKLMFTLDDQSKMSVAQYYRNKYNIGLKFPSLPAIQSGSEAKPVYYPMELCKIAEGQRYTKKLNEQQVRSILRATCQRPNEREGNVKKMVEANNFGADELVGNEFGMQVQKELAVIDARVLPPPMLKYHDSGRERSVCPNMGQWNMMNMKMVNGGRIDFWTCINFSGRFYELVGDFCVELVNMCNRKGMVFCPTPSIEPRTVNADKIDQTLREVFKESKDLKIQLQLLIIILPDQTGSYGKIKRICETELGIVSQCCKPDIAKKFSPQYFENLALKINVKVGGRNNVLSDAISKRIPLVSDRPTIIFGADVTHPMPGEDSGSSIAAVVASMDWPEITKYRGLISAQPHREEIIQDLYKVTHDPVKGAVHGGMIRDLLRAFRMSTGKIPERIIFYRDGVSEGQFSQVLLHEMDAIRRACSSLQEGYMPPVTFVVVQKRHHTRLFPADRNQDRSGNVLPGTVVDTKICHPTEFDFYLNSHAGIQGTSKPSHYHVLYDENKFSADLLQMLTNSLCYTYARCTKAVSIVPPAYYAHLLAFRARYYVEDEMSDSSSTGENRRAVGLPTIKDNVKDVMFYC